MFLPVIPGNCKISSFFCFYKPRGPPLAIQWLRLHARGTGLIPDQGINDPRGSMVWPKIENKVKKRKKLNKNLMSQGGQQSSVGVESCPNVDEEITGRPCLQMDTGGDL